jgi:hypothetical protein
MADQLYAGSLSDFDTVPNMAKAMEDSLAAQIGPLQGDPTMRRQVLIALAQGVINHLKQEQKAFQVNINGSDSAGDTFTVSAFPSIQVHP